MNGIQLCYVKNAKYLGYTLDQEITSNKHIEAQVIKARKRLNVLKFISGRDWGAEASTLCTTFVSLIRPVLEFGIPIYSCASDTNLNKLERVQLCAARIITGLRYSCQNDIVLFKSNLPSLSKRRLYSLTRYFNKLYSYNEQHRTSAYLHAWINNRRMMKHSPFSCARTLNLPSSDVEPHSLSFTGAGLELYGIYFHDLFLTSVTKSSEIPALVNQLALETINGIPQSSLKIHTDGSRGEKGISGSGVYIPTPSGALEFKIKNPNYNSVFRSELIAIRRSLQCAAQLEDRFQEIWILTDSRASIQNLANWGDIGDQTSLDILSLLHDLSSGHSIHFQWIPSHVGIEGNERADFLARTAAVEGVSPRGNLSFSEISTISKLELNRQIKTLYPVMHGTLLNVRASPLDSVVDLSNLFILDF
ncbi:RNase H domain-containing protein [Trichonephila clavipes]|nr:RNase H domain-containing protein [Trichonephila clavipes]